MEKELYAHLPAEVKSCTLKAGEVVTNCIDCTGEKLACKRECCLGAILRCPHNCCPNKKRWTDHSKDFQDLMHAHDLMHALD